MKTFAVSLLACVAMIAVTTPPATAQDAPRVFTRSGSWALDAGEESCQLARVFTNGEDQVSLALERIKAENQVRMIVVGNAVRTFRQADEVGYRFMPANDQRSARYISAETPDGEAYYNFGNVTLGANPFAAMDAGGPPPGPPGAGGPPPGGPDGFAPPLYDRAAELEFGAGITAIEFNEGLLAPIRLETGSLRGAMEALQACTDDLLRSWGLDWQKHQTMTRRAAPAGPAFEWVPEGVVSFEDFAAFGGARNPFRVMVDATGKPTACQAHWVSLEPRQNEQICQGIMANGNFTPALDAAGEPMASYWMVDYMFGLSRPFGR
ncbi:MAG TPA: hypothetical protein VLA45_00840 [Paracoccaceae bacterium]|nr:hypothetical protein [Paracoccaceae bacterium]